MPSFGEILESAAAKAGQVGEAIAKPAIGTAAERAAQPNALIEKAAALPSEVTQRAPSVPFTGDPTLQGATRATSAPYQTLSDHVRALKEGVMGFWRPDPGVDTGIERKLVNGRHAEQQASYLAAKAIADAHATIIGDLPKVTASYDYRITADNVAQAVRDGRSAIRVVDDNGRLVDTPVDKWIAQKAKMEASPLLQDPGVQQTLGNMSSLWNDVHTDMVNEGAIVPERYLSEYTPMRMMHGVAKGLSKVIGDDGLVDKLAQAQRRAGPGGSRETNLAEVEHGVLTKYFQWKANKKLFNDVLSDPALDRSAEFDPGEVPPHGWEWYNPGPGMPGYQPVPPDQEMLNSAMRTLGSNSTSRNTFNQGRLIPSPVAKAFKQMRIQGVDEQSSYFTKLARSAMRWVIPYNPSSRVANVIGDIPIAMMGLPGEAAHPLGVLRWYPQGFAAGMRDAFNGKGTRVRMGNQIVDVSDLIHEYNIGGHTQMAQMASGTKIHPELTGLVDPSQLPPLGPGRFMQSLSQGLELGPRIAAGLDALQRTGNPDEFGRVAQRATLEYGAGAPAWARDPHLRVLSPVIQFAGLMMGRMVDMLRAEGSRARTIAALAGIPLAIAAWNVHDDEYRKILNSIPESARDQSVLIVPDPRTGRPWRDVTGKPVITRLQWNVPDQMLSLVGLGNLPTRIGRVATGRDTPGQFAEQSGESVAKNLANYLTVPGLIRDVLSDKDQYGREQEPMDRLLHLAPILKIPIETAKGAANYGPLVGASRFAEQATGQSFVKPTMRGNAVMDAGMMERRQAIKDATSRARSARVPSDRQHWLQKRKEAVQELQRYVKATHETPPPEDDNANQ